MPASKLTQTTTTIAQKSSPSQRRVDFKALGALFQKRLLEHRGEVIVCSERQLPTKLMKVISEHGIKKLLLPSDEGIAKVTHALERSSQPTSSLAKGPKGKRGGEGLKLVRMDRPIEKMKPAIFSADAGFEQVAYGLAETGTLVVDSSPSHPRTISLVPPIHLAWLRRENLLSNFNRLTALYHGEALPSNLILISGPSKTADIELTLVHGIHGPKKLIVFLTD